MSGNSSVVDVGGPMAPGAPAPAVVHGVVVDEDAGGGSTINDTINRIQNLVPEINISDIPGVNQPRTYFAIFMCSLIFSIFWITYITFCNSRVVGSILTRLANSQMIQRFIGQHGGHIEVRLRNSFFRVTTVVYYAGYTFVNR